VAESAGRGRVVRHALVDGRHGARAAAAIVTGPAGYTIRRGHQKPLMAVALVLG
jgi:hypothetical protein